MSFSKQNFFTQGNINPSFNQPFFNSGFAPQNINQNFGFNNGNSSQLQNILTGCSYNPQHFYSVFEAANKLLSIHPQLQPDVFRANDNFNSKSLLLMQGLIEVTVNAKGERMQFLISIFFPQQYPQHPPIPRVVNIDPEMFQVNPMYEVFESSEFRHCYRISTFLNTIERWSANSSIVDLMREIEMVLGKNRPFRRITQGHGSSINTYHRSQSANNGWNSSGYNGNSQGSGQGNWDWEGYNKNKGSNVNQGNGGWTNLDPNWNSGSIPNQGFNNNPNTPYSSKVSHNSNPPPHNTNSTPGNNPVNKNLPSKLSAEQQTARNQLEDFVTRSINFASASKKMCQKLLAEKQKDFKSIQQLQPVVHNLKISRQQLGLVTKQMLYFIKQNEKEEEIDLKKLFSPKDQESSQLLQLACINRAANDTLCEIQGMFGAGKITLEQLLKLTRKIEEEKFMSRVMIKKKLQDKK